MSMLEHLKQLEQEAREAADSDFDNTDERMDTAESFDFAYALQGAWPKLLAVVEAFKAMNLRCDAEDPFDDEPACGDCEVCRVNALLAEVTG